MLEFELKDLDNTHQKLGIKVKIPSKIRRKWCKHNNELIIKIGLSGMGSNDYLHGTFDVDECEECKRISIQHLTAIVDFINNKQ